MKEIEITKINYDGGFAWAETETDENIFQVCVDEDSLFDPNDCGYDWGICGDYNYSKHGKNIEKVFEIFCNAIAEYNAEHLFNKLADKEIKDEISDLKRQRKIAKQDDLLDEFVSFLEDRKKLADFDHIQAETLSSLFDTDDICSLDCYDESCGWRTDKEWELEMELDEMIREIKERE